MKSKFRSISLSYKTAPVKIREKVALTEEQSLSLIHSLKSILNLNDLLVLSTCNRTEIYYSSTQDLHNEIIKMLALEKGIESTENLLQYFELTNNNRESIAHLFYVAIGLDSQVIGDVQIISQVKRAYQMSADADVAGPVLHRVMHSIFFTNKRVVQETSFRDGAASVSYATADLISEIAKNIIEPQILCIGVGEIGTDVVRNLKDFGFKNVIIINRTYAKAVELAQECGFKAEVFEKLNSLLESSEAVISSISAQAPVITDSLVSGLNIPGYKHFIDLSMPRSIDPQVEKIAGVSLHNIDHIKAKTDDTLKKRLAAVDQVKAIINESLEEYYEWSKEVLVSPTLKKFKNALEDIRQEELKKYLKKLDPEQAKMMDEITKSLLKKIVKLPALSLKAACKRDDAESLADVLNELFNLEGKMEEKKEGDHR